MFVSLVAARLAYEFRAVFCGPSPVFDFGSLLRVRALFGVGDVERAWGCMAWRRRQQPSG
ncbi:hypothetical protein ACI2KC_15915 [Pseudomonas monteilii]